MNSPVALLRWAGGVASWLIVYVTIGLVGPPAVAPATQRVVPPQISSIGLPLFDDPVPFDGDCWRCDGYSWTHCSTSRFLNGQEIIEHWRPGEIICADDSSGRRVIDGDDWKHRGGTWKKIPLH